MNRTGLGYTARHMAPEITFNGARIDTKTGKKLPDGIEVRFGDYVPSTETRAALKKAGFRFSEKQKMWYAKDDASTKEFIEQWATDEVEVLDFSEEVRVDGQNRHYFWAKVHKADDWKMVPRMARIMVRSIDGGTKHQFYTKLMAPDLSKEIDEGRVLFQKFYTKKEANTDDPENEDQDGEKQYNKAPKKGSKSSAEVVDDLELMELEAQAELELLALETEELELKAKERKSLGRLYEDIMLGYFGEEIGLTNKQVWLTKASANHIENNHLDQLMSKGFTVESFVKHVFNHHSTVLLGSQNSYLLECGLNGSHKRHGILAILISESTNGNFVVATAFIAKENWVKKKPGWKGGTTLLEI